MSKYNSFSWNCLNQSVNNSVTMDGSSTRGMKRKQTFNDIIPTKKSMILRSQFHQKPQHYKEKVLYLKAVHSTQHKLMKILDATSCLHRTVLLNNFGRKLREDIIKLKNNSPSKWKKSSRRPTWTIVYFGKKSICIRKNKNLWQNMKWVHFIFSNYYVQQIRY